MEHSVRHGSERRRKVFDAHRIVVLVPPGQAADERGGIRLEGKVSLPAVGALRPASKVGPERLTDTPTEVRVRPEEEVESVAHFGVECGKLRYRVLSKLRRQGNVTHLLPDGCEKPILGKATQVVDVVDGVLSIDFPLITPGAILRGHKARLAIEFSNWIEAAATQQGV